MTITSQRVALESLAGSGVSALSEAVKAQAWQAAEDYVARRCRWPRVDQLGAPVEAPAALVTAVQLLTARLLERRNTPSGVLGSGDFGVVRISGSDRDVDAMIAPWRRLVVG